MRSAALAAIVACVVALHAQQPPAVDLNAIGPKVGEVAPDFELLDQQGVTRKMSSLLGPRGAMLVFYRSADW